MKVFNEIIENTCTIIELLIEVNDLQRNYSKEENKRNNIKL